jgi:hypothetical protein
MARPPLVGYIPPQVNDCETATGKRGRPLSAATKRINTRAASSVTIADWTLEPPANTQLLAAPFATRDASAAAHRRKERQ